MMIPEGDFSCLWDLQGCSGVAVRTEVSAQTGTADVTPLFADLPRLTTLTSLSPSPFYSQVLSKDQ